VPTRGALGFLRLTAECAWQVLQCFPTHDDWTEDETRDLLDAVCRAGEEWDVVAAMVRTKTMEQCVLHFARLPIADRYLLDINPMYADEDKLVTPGRGASAAALASAAFPVEWSPEWSKWLQQIVSVEGKEAAALGPALAASLAAVDGMLEEPAGDVGSNAPALLEGGDGNRGNGTVDVSNTNSWEAPAASCYWDAEARPSADHPWMSVLAWPAPSGLPRAKHLKEGDYVLLLSAEAGKFRRGCVLAVHSARAGVMSVDVCAGQGVKVLQLSCVEYRVLTSEEVATIERTIGCAFMGTSPAEAERQEGEAAADADPAVQVLPAKAIKAASSPAAAHDPNPSELDAHTAASARTADAAGVVNGAALEAELAVAADVAGHGLQLEELAEEDAATAHRHNLWDASGAPAVQVMWRCL